jgi:uncharacterized repeat protein (TIGR03803 family)
MYTRTLTVIAALAAGTMLPPSIANAQTLTTIYSFQGAGDGSNPTWLIFRSGDLYGTAEVGTGGIGIVFKIDIAAGREKTIYNFHGIMDGSFPNELQFVNGSVYGTTEDGGGTACVGGTGCGTIFQLNPRTGAETVLFEFSTSGSTGGAGSFPQPGTIDENGTLYGTTEIGGYSSCDTICCDYGCGTIFSFNLKTGAESPVYDFIGSTGSRPQYGMIDVGGTLYGTTTGGGASGHGTLFAYDTASNQQSTLYSFHGTHDGALSQGQLVYSNGRLYGTMAEGGSTSCTYGCGTLFAYDVAKGTYSVSYKFAGGTDGSYPYGPTALHSGVIYGTTQFGGGNGCGGTGCGTVFAIDLKTRGESILYRFTGGQDGSSPYALIYHGGSLYGVTQAGGAQGFGTVFKLTL